MLSVFKKFECAKPTFRRRWRGLGRCIVPLRWNGLSKWLPSFSAVVSLIHFVGCNKPPSFGINEIKGANNINIPVGISAYGENNLPSFSSIHCSPKPLVSSQPAFLLVDELY